MLEAVKNACVFYVQLIITKLNTLVKYQIKKRLKALVKTLKLHLFNSSYTATEMLNNNTAHALTLTKRDITNIYVSSIHTHARTHIRIYIYIYIYIYIIYYTIYIIYTIYIYIYIYIYILST